MGKSINFYSIRFFCITYSISNSFRWACLQYAIKIIIIFDVFGRESKNKNQPLFYLYDDGTVEKKIILE